MKSACQALGSPPETPGIKSALGAFRTRGRGRSTVVQRTHSEKEGGKKEGRTEGALVEGRQVGRKDQRDTGANLLLTEKVAPRRRQTAKPGICKSMTLCSGLCSATKKSHRNVPSK